MATVTCNPVLRCPFCASESLTLLRTKMYLAFDIVEEGEEKESASVTALLCGENHFFFIRSSDIPSSVLLAGAHLA
jgi:hypothetical protein